MKAEMRERERYIQYEVTIRKRYAARDTCIQPTSSYKFKDGESVYNSLVRGSWFAAR